MSDKKKVCWNNCPGLKPLRIRTSFKMIVECQECGNVYATDASDADLIAELRLHDYEVYKNTDSGPMCIGAMRILDAPKGDRDGQPE